MRRNGSPFLRRKAELDSAAVVAALRLRAHRRVRSWRDRLRALLVALLKRSK